MRREEYDLLISKMFDQVFNIQKAVQHKPTLKVVWKKTVFSKKEILQFFGNLNVSKLTLDENIYFGHEFFKKAFHSSTTSLGNFWRDKSRISY